MKNLILLFALIITISLNGQDRIARGYVIDRLNKTVIDSAAVNVIGTDTIIFTNEIGIFSIHVPKKNHYLLISKEGYKIVKITLKPGFQHRPLSIGLQPIFYTLLTDSIYLTYRNAVMFSPLELIGGAIGIQYERFLHRNHSLGMHGSFYLFGRNPLRLNSGSIYNVKFQGFKLSPFYRFYPLKIHSIGLFVEAKFPFGLIHFDELVYRHSSTYLSKRIEYEFWSVGYGLSIGFMFRLPRSKHGIGNLSFVYQYFPINIPETIEVELSNGQIVTAETNSDWWYRIGPGSRFQFKFAIGGIF